ncbi:MAG: serine hydrolase domain-containing protein, partial [Cyanobacteria bacterium P01_C01_bin.121]
YSLASSLVEEVSGDTFSAFMANRMFEPIGMNHTDVIRDSYLLNNHAMGYFADGNYSLQPLSQVLSGDNSIRKIMHGLQGAGSVTSNVLDLARWEIALQKGQLLDSAMQAEMYELGTMTSGKRTGYGLGWFVKDINGHTAISHGGNLWGYSTSISRFPDDQLTVIVLTNKNGEDGDRIARKIAEQYIPDLAIDGNAPAIADPTPAITEKILAFVNGDETAIEMTPEDQIARTSTVRGRQMYAQWVDRSRQAPVKELELLAVASHPNGTKHRYRATTDSGARFLSIVITPDGFISGMDMSLEDG